MSGARRQQSSAPNAAAAEPIALCFSGGKDSVLALREVQREQSYCVVELLTTVTLEYGRVSMHGVRRALVREQASALGIRLMEVGVPPNSSNVAYEREMGRVFGRLRRQGIKRRQVG